MEIRRSSDRLISTIGIPILIRCHLYIESGPWLPRESCWHMPAGLARLKNRNMQLHFLCDLFPYIYSQVIIGCRKNFVSVFLLLRQISAWDISSVSNLNIRDIICKWKDNLQNEAAYFLWHIVYVPAWVPWMIMRPEFVGPTGNQT